MDAYEQYLRDEFGYDENLEEDEYEVEKILKHRVVRHGKKRTTEYYIKWKGFDDNWNTWEPESKVDADELVNEYWLSKPSKRKRTEPTLNTQKRLRSTTSDPIVSDPSTDVEQDSERPSRARKQSTKTPAPAPAPASSLHSSATNDIPPYKSIVHTEGKVHEQNEKETVQEDAMSFISDLEDEESVVLDSPEQRPTSATSTSTATTTTARTEASEPASNPVWPGDSNVDEVIFDLDFRIELSWDWKNSVRRVEAVTQEGPVLYGVIRWEDDTLSMYPTDLIRRRCAQKLIDFYERKLEFEQPLMKQRTKSTK